MMTVNCIKRRRGRMGASYLRKEIKKYIRRRWNEMRPNVEWSSLSGCDAALQASATLLQTCPVTLPFVLLWCSCAMPDSGSVSVDNLCSCLFFFSFLKKNKRYPDTAHQNKKRKGISCVSEIPDFETFQSFRHENLLGHRNACSPRLERYPPARKHSLRLSRDPMWKGMVPSLCTHYNKLHL